jgi:transposase InsO family protein
MKCKIQTLDDTSIRETIKTLRDDKGGEYSSNQFRDFHLEHGIQRERTIRDTPQQNGLAERLNRTISEGVTAMLSESKLPTSLWADAAKAFVYVHNRTPSHSRGFKSPYKLWSGQKPSVSHLRVWGCRAYVHLQKDQRTPLSSHARTCVES